MKEKAHKLLSSQNDEDKIVGLKLLLKELGLGKAIFSLWTMGCKMKNTYYYFWQGEEMFAFCPMGLWKVAPYNYNYNYITKAYKLIEL